MTREFCVERGGQEKAHLQVEIADSFFRRFLGLMGRRALPAGQGLLLAPCNNVHMCFMRFAIDVAYLDRAYRVVKLVLSLPPWIGLSMAPGAWAALELPAGDAVRLGIRVGDTIRPCEEHARP